VEASFLEQLYRDYSGHVLRRASAIMGDAEAGKDVTQEVFLRALGAHVELTSEAASLSWLYRITTNLCLNRLRDAARRRDILGRKWIADETAVRLEPDATLTVRALLGNVTPQMREIAIHYFVGEMSQGEISSLLDVPRRTVGYRLEQFRVIVRDAAKRRGNNLMKPLPSPGRWSVLLGDTRKSA
jgi:RNA polymerase sigma-70 factor (ECF subfamily)